jgi:hypothetical protein
LQAVLVDVFNCKGRVVTPGARRVEGGKATRFWAVVVGVNIAIAAIMNLVIGSLNILEKEYLTLKAKREFILKKRIYLIEYLFVEFSCIN